MDLQDSARTPRSSPCRPDATVAAELARGDLRAVSAAADAERRLCVEGLQALEGAGLVGYFVPPELGGPGGTIAEFAAIAGELGAGCLSTAMNWAMNAHQVLVLVDHGGEPVQPVLRRVADEQLWIASVTSEAATGGDLLAVDAALEEEDGCLRLRRDAPYVSYGEYAAFFLITMRRDADSSRHDVRLVLVERGEGEVHVEGEWQAMGLLGTASVPMSFDVRVGSNRVLPVPMPEIAARTMVPTAHVGWAAAWLGGARGAFRRVVAQLRHTRSERVLHRLGELRLSLDQGDALLERVVRELDQMRVERAPIGAYERVPFQLRVHGLKVAAARIAFEVVDGLVQLAGLRAGYLQGRGSDLERVFRDLRAASLMLNDDGLLARNGRMLLAEEAGLARPR